jgi:hypothetical protein
MNKKILLLFALLILILAGSCHNVVYDFPESEPIQEFEGESTRSSAGGVYIMDISYGQTASDISCNAFSRETYIISASNLTPYGGFMYKNVSNNPWTSIQGVAEHISVGHNTLPWCVNKQGLIYECVQGTGWVERPGSHNMRARDIGVGKTGEVFIISTIPHASGQGYKIYKWYEDYNNWYEVSGPGFMKIDVDFYGKPWCIDAEGKVFTWMPHSWDWVCVTGSNDPRAIDIGSLDNRPYIVSNRPAADGYKIYVWLPYDRDYVQYWNPQYWRWCDMKHYLTGLPVAGVKVEGVCNAFYFCRDYNKIFYV